MIDRKVWKNKAHSRDCSCVNGKDRDTNFNEVIDEIINMYENIIKIQSELRIEERNRYENKIRAMVEKNHCCI